MTDIDLTLVIVSYQVRAHLERCLYSLEDVPSTLQLQMVVVDNGSTDGSIELIRTQFPNVELLVNTENVGFARASNQGLAQARGRYWMLLNPDTEIPRASPSALDLMVEFMDWHPLAGACGPSLFYANGVRQHSAFRFPTLGQIYMDLFPVNWRLRESRWNGRYPLAWYEWGAPFVIDHPLGAALLVRPAAALQVGLLDPDYFIYAEEVDWCMRLKRAGWQVWCVPAARIIHHEGQSTRQFRERMFVELWRARFLLFAKHYSWLFNAQARWLVRRGMVRAINLAVAQQARGQLSSEELSQRLLAYREVIDLTRRLELVVGRRPGAE